MKSTFTLFTLLLLFTATFTYAQSTSTIDLKADIAVQGIARDNNNTARTDTEIRLDFELYYKESGGGEAPIGAPKNVTLTTDAFGVFSYNIGSEAINNPLFANHQAYLRISDENGIISDQKLNHVPYAISANNGVPTGSIMPFVGDTAPVGWVMCDGSALPNDGSANALKDLLGGQSVTRAPDLRGFFLRGAGVNEVADYTTNSGPTLNTTQQDANLSHLHGVNITTSNSGTHDHGIGNNGENTGTPNARNAKVSVNAEAHMASNSFRTTNNGAHTHTVTGNTAAEGSESRPVNYGVNYIIKL